MQYNDDASSTPPRCSDTPRIGGGLGGKRHGHRRRRARASSASSSSCCCSVLGGGGGGSSAASPTSSASSGSRRQPATADNTAARARSARPAPTPTPSSTAPSSPTSTRSRRTGPSELPKLGTTYTPVPTVWFTGQVQHRLRRGVAARAGPFYCPADKHGLHRPDLLQRPADAVRRDRRAVRRRLRPGARVRPPRPGPARHRGEGASRARPGRRRARCGSNCRPTATPASGPTTPSTVPTRVGPAADHRHHAGRHHQRARHGGPDRRRLHPDARSSTRPFNARDARRTARRRSGRSGSPTGYQTGDPKRATRSAAKTL